MQRAKTEALTKRSLEHWDGELEGAWKEHPGLLKPKVLQKQMSLKQKGKKPKALRPLRRSRAGFAGPVGQEAQKELPRLLRGRSTSSGPGAVALPWRRRDGSHGKGRAGCFADGLKKIPRSGRRQQNRHICLATFWVDFKTNDNVGYDKPKQVACGKLTAA